MVWHRNYVGGLWEAIGRLQFDYLVANGLLPSHSLLDVACGSLRAGVHFIPYLDVGCYLGIDKSPKLIEQGLRHELSPADFAEKKPQFVISSAFEFELFGVSPSFALAQSLFTHLPLFDIEQCLRKLKPVLTATGVFYATFNECDVEARNPEQAHDHLIFRYTREQMAVVASATGWQMDYIGDWNHPRNQKMLAFRP